MGLMAKKHLIYQVLISKYITLEFFKILYNWTYKYRVIGPLEIFSQMMTDSCFEQTNVVVSICFLILAHLKYYLVIYFFPLPFFLYFLQGDWFFLSLSELLFGRHLRIISYLVNGINYITFVFYSLLWIFLILFF